MLSLVVCAFSVLAASVARQHPASTVPLYSAPKSTLLARDDFDSTQLLSIRAECKTQKVISGDSCGSLAKKCGISGSDLTKYNPKKDLCSTLTVDQLVCCSPGTLPDRRPKQNPDGSCAIYNVKGGNTCSSIAAAHGLTAKDLATFNNKVTWGWLGCDRLLAGTSICLSKGSPPLPAPQANAICGPTKPGTKPVKGKKIADLNPCPLNACCNVWGQCGITPEFCNATTGPTGNPGTAPKGQNGCISNCGTKIVSGDPAKDFNHIGYYESFNWERPCLNMRAEHIDTTFYSHVHWAFALITKDLDVSINDTYKQFSGFKSIGAKRIISFEDGDTRRSPQHTMYCDRP